MFHVKYSHRDILVSSVKMRMFVFIQSSRSLMKNRKRSGPRTEPWGTPLSTFVQEELATINNDSHCLSCHKKSIHLSKSPLKPKSCRNSYVLYRMVLFPVTSNDLNYPQTTQFSTFCIDLHSEWR